MILNIDGDLVCYRCAASVGEQGTEEIAILRTDKLMRDLLYNTGSDEYRCYLTGKGNFRYKINESYKANRKDTPKPQWLQSCREYLISEFSAYVTNGCEADDYLGISQEERTTCASLDKDLLMIPGWHFRWLENEKIYVVPLDGLKHFYKQMLIGDKTDNIFGVVGLGKVKAAKIIDPLETEEEMIQTVFDLYDEDAERFYMNANCLWIMQEKGVIWHHHAESLILPQQLRQELDKKSDFMTSLMEGISMEHGTTQKMMSGIPVNGEVMVVSPQIQEMT